jgi:signal transduction histidine kinase
LSKIAVLIIGCIVYALPALPQTQRIDSLRAQVYQQHLRNSQKLQTAIALCNQYGSLHPDSLMAHLQLCSAWAAPNSKEQLIMRHLLSIYYSRKGKIDSALLQLDTAITQPPIQQHPDLMLRCKMSKTGLLVRQNKLKEALENALQILAEAEAKNILEYKVKAETQIGWVYMELGVWKDAIGWLSKAKNSNKMLQLPAAEAVICSNMAAVYNSIGKNDSALAFVNESIAQATAAQELSFLCNGHYIRADVFTDLGMLQLAEQNLQTGIAIRKKIGDPFYITADLAQLAKFYTITKQYPKSEMAVQEGIAIARQYQLNQKLLFLYNALADNYKATGNWNAYSQTLQTIIGLKDTLYNQNSASAIQELQTRYQLQKKENTIYQQKLALVYKNYWMYGILLAFIFGGILWAMYLRQQKRKQLQDLALATLKQQQQAEKNIALAEEKERKRIAADLHDNLGAYAAAIAANADYLLQQQQPANQQDAVQELHHNAQAIITQLNDTIWVLTKETLSLTAISDRLKVFIHRLQKSYPSLQADVTEKIEQDHVLPAAQALHLFKLLQEAIVNAIRHSGSPTIAITIYSNQHWQITIADNGRGMAAAPSPGGFGLHNMRKRAAEAGWQLQWLGTTGGGTTVQITASVSN